MKSRLIVVATLLMLLASARFGFAQGGGGAPDTLEQQRRVLEINKLESEQQKLGFEAKKAKFEVEEQQQGFRAPSKWPAVVGVLGAVLVPLLTFLIGRLHKVKDDAHARQNKMVDEAYARQNKLVDEAYARQDKLASEAYARQDKLASEAYARQNKLADDVREWQNKLELARLEMREALNQPLHERRVLVYADLTKAASAFAIYFPHRLDGSLIGRLSKGDCAAAGEEMSKWYFGGGGLLLSSQARKAYFRLATAVSRAALTDDLNVPELPRDTQELSWRSIETYRRELKLSDAGLDDEQWLFGEKAGETHAERFKDYVLLQTLASRLRTELAEDLGSRRRPAGVEQAAGM